MVLCPLAGHRQGWVLAFGSAQTQPSRQPTAIAVGTAAASMFQVPGHRRHQGLLSVGNHPAIALLLTMPMNKRRRMWRS